MQNNGHPNYGDEHQEHLEHLVQQHQSWHLPNAYPVHHQAYPWNHHHVNRPLLTVPTTFVPPHFLPPPFPLPPVHHIPFGHSAFRPVVPYGPLYNYQLAESINEVAVRQFAFQSTMHQYPRPPLMLQESSNPNSNSSSNSSTQPSTPSPSGMSTSLSNSNSSEGLADQLFSGSHSVPMVLNHPTAAVHGYAGGLPPCGFNHHHYHNPLMHLPSLFQEMKTEIGILKNLEMKSLTDNDTNFGHSCLYFFRRDLLHSKKPIPLLFKHAKKPLFKIFERYFNHLHDQLYANKDLINAFESDELELYRVLINSSKYPFDDFVVYGDRFKQFLEQFMKIKPEKRYYIALLEVHESYIPSNIKSFRKSLLEILKSPNPTTFKENQVDLKMATYLVVDERKLFSKITKIDNIQNAIDYFIKKVSLSSEAKNNLKLFKELVKSILEEALPQLGPTVSLFGSLINGLGLYDADLDLVVHFTASPFRVYEHMDYWTAFLLLEVIEKTLQRQLNLPAYSGSRIVTSRRCPIVKLDFESCFPKLHKEVEQLNHHAPKVLKLNQCDISVTSHFGVFNSNLLKFYSDFDRRFTELSIILKYWLKKNELIGSKSLSSYALELMIIFFLQTRSPPVLPSLQELQMMATEETVVNNGVNITFCQDVYRVRAEWTAKDNFDPTSELLVDFINYYYNFKYTVHAITPRSGRMTTKSALFNEKSLQNRINFRESYFTIEDPFVADHNVGCIFKSAYIDHYKDVFTKALYTHNINPDNCLEVLTNPKNFTKGPNI